MSHDVECPYCGAGQEINHNDGYGYEEGKRHEQQCGECDKNFVFNTSISLDYEVEKADCLNGEPHELEKVVHCPNGIFPDWVRCKNCDYGSRGKYVEPKKEES